MRFTGRVYFDFAAPAVWRFYRLLTTAARRGVELRMAWRSFAPEGDEAGRRALASFEEVLDRAPERHGAYLQALLAQHHLDGRAVDDPEAWRLAAEVARVPAPRDPEAYLPAVDASTAAARELGVRATPTIYRHGPVLEVDVTPAAYAGDVVARLALIDAVLEDDGIWRLVKP
ncbi:MAG TPA: hypothetical protein ENK55_06160 [Actinobacteria bacterium]|nr:hypothetical protein [Actinomycetota bacterium]